MAEEDTQGRRRRRSAVWEHFDRFTDADGMDKAGCKRCRKVLAAGTLNGTSSLSRHVKICNEQQGARQESPPPRPPPPPCAPPTRSSESSSRLQPGPGLEEKEEEEEDDDRKPALEGAGTHLNDNQYECSFPSTLDLESLLRWMEHGEASRQHQWTEQGEASRDLARMIALHGYDPSVVEDDYFRSFVRHLNPEFRLPSRHTIEEMCDGFFDKTRTDLFDKLRRTSGRVSLAVGKAEGGAMYTACHFIDEEWSLHRIVMDAYDHIPWAHSHWPLTEVPEASQDFYVLHTAAINRVMDGVQGYKDGFDRVFMVARDQRDVRVNSKEYFRQKKFPSCITNPRRKDLICETYMDSVFHHVARQLILHPQLVMDMTEVHSIESGVQGLHLTRQKQQHLLSRLGLDDPRAYNERWYSYYCYLQLLRDQGSCRVVARAIGSALIGFLCSIWGTIYCAIKRISASNGPTSNLVLRELFHVREVLQDEISQNDGRNADVLRDAMDTLDKSIQDSYLVWSLPLVLDPRYKLKYMEFYFPRAFHSERSAYYISEVTRHIKKLYDDYIKCDGGISGTSDGATAMASGRTELLERAWAEHCCAQDGKTELDRYLKDSVVSPLTEGFDILKWWKENSPKYPTMAQMAREALAMPTSSQLSSEQIAHVRSIIRAYSKRDCDWKRGNISTTAVTTFPSFR